MTFTEECITIGLCVLGTLITRFLPFMIFSEKRKTPSFIIYLGQYLPAAVFAMLVVYCIKDVNFTSGNFGIPETLGIIVTGLVHFWKKQMITSMAVGTVFYMIIINLNYFYKY